MIKKSLSTLSVSNSGIVVCDYDDEFIDFDNSKGLLRRSSVPKSPDMLYLNDIKKEAWFIEFKSSNHNTLDSWKEKSKLRKKVFAGLFLLYELACDKTCDYKDYDKFYFVVYNKERPVCFEEEVLENFSELSQRAIEFGLDDLKPQFVKDVFTEDCQSLKELFEHRFNIQFVKENQ